MSASYSPACITAHLDGFVHHGEVEFYCKNTKLGSISVYGAWLDTVQIENDGYFKDSEQFEREKKFIEVYNTGDRLKVKEITGGPC